MPCQTDSLAIRMQKYENFYYSANFRMIFYAEFLTRQCLHQRSCPKATNIQCIDKFFP